MIVVAPSYAGLVYALERYPLSEISVISNNVNIQKFCSKIGTTCWPLTIESSIEKSLVFNPAISSIEKQHFLFCFHRFDLTSLQFLYEIKNKNNVYFHNLDPEFNQVKIPKSKLDLGRIKELYLKKKQTKLPLKLFKINNDRYYFGIKPMQLSKDFNQHTTASNPSVLNANKQKILSSYNLDATLCIYVDQGNSVFEVPDTLIEIISKNLKQALALKLHPSFPISNQKWLSIGFELPQEIPAEILINDTTRVIGIASTSLQNNKNSISLAHLVTWKNQKDVNRYINLLNLDQHHLPKSLEELELLIQKMQLNAD